MTNEVDKEWVHEKCGTNTPPKTAPKHPSIGNKGIKRRVSTAKDYDKYIKSLQEEVEQLHIQLLDVSCNLSALKKQLEVAIIERDKKASKKAKEKVEKAGVKPKGSNIKS